MSCCCCNCNCCGCGCNCGCSGCCCCKQEIAPLTRRQRFLPRTSNPCLRPCCIPQCVDTYSGCRAFRPRYRCITGTFGCDPQLQRCCRCCCCQCCQCSCCC